MKWGCYNSLCRDARGLGSPGSAFLCGLNARPVDNRGTAGRRAVCAHTHFPRLCLLLTCLSQQHCTNQARKFTTQTPELSYVKRNQAAVTGKPVRPEQPRSRGPTQAREQEGLAGHRPGTPAGCNREGRPLPASLGGEVPQGEPPAAGEPPGLRRSCRTAGPCLGLSWTPCAQLSTCHRGRHDDRNAKFSRHSKTMSFTRVSCTVICNDPFVRTPP